jgi:hypothetical protein
MAFRETYPVIFDRKNMEQVPSGKESKTLPAPQPEKSVKFSHHQFLDLMALYEL